MFVCEKNMGQSGRILPSCKIFINHSLIQATRHSGPKLQIEKRRTD